MKVCKKCNLEKDFSEFNKLKNSKDGLNYYCKPCYSEKMYEYRNTDEYRNKRRENYINNREYYLEQKKDYYINNIEKIKEKDKKYYEFNKELIGEYKSKYREINKESIAIYQLEYRKNNRETARLYHSQYQKNRNAIDSVFKLSNNIRSLIKISIKNSGYIKNSKSFDILGCSIEEFKKYLESNFEPWMNWDNHGKYNGELNYGWDIDHIIPISSIKEEGEVYKLNHYTNLQPLCSKINRDIKRNKVNYYSKSPSFDEIK